MSNNTVIITDKKGIKHTLTATARFLGTTNGPLRHSQWQGQLIDRYETIVFYTDSYYAFKDDAIQAALHANPDFIAI